MVAVCVIVVIIVRLLGGLFESWSSLSVLLCDGLSSWLSDWLSSGFGMHLGLNWMGDLLLSFMGDFLVLFDGTVLAHWSKMGLRQRILMDSLPVKFVEVLISWALLTFNVMQVVVFSQRSVEVRVLVLSVPFCLLLIRIKVTVIFMILLVNVVITDKFLRELVMEAQSLMFVLFGPDHL